jgi:hypothetical protein
MFIVTDSIKNNGTHAVDGVCWRSAFIETDIVRIPLPLIGRMASTDTAEH